MRRLTVPSELLLLLLLFYFGFCISKGFFPYLFPSFLGVVCAGVYLVFSLCSGRCVQGFRRRVRCGARRRLFTSFLSVGSFYGSCLLRVWVFGSHFLVLFCLHLVSVLPLGWGGRVVPGSCLALSLH